MAAMTFFGSLYNYFISGVWKDYFKTKFTVTDQNMSFLLTFGAIANSLARPLTGLLL